jgi:hypothetical protein
MLALNAQWSKSMEAKLVNTTVWGNLVLMFLLSVTWTMQAQVSLALKL